jgi:hypothetical protein
MSGKLQWAPSAGCFSGVSSTLWCHRLIELTTGTGEVRERKTAKALRRLPKEEWRVWHDLLREDGTNIDHVVVGVAGVFLLDSKTLTGRITVDNAGLHTQWLEDSHVARVSRATFGQVAAASAELKDRIQAATGIVAWVQPVVVLWGRFEQGIVRTDDIIFVHGNELVRCLCDSAPARRAFDRAQIADFLDQAARDGLPASKRAEPAHSPHDEAS